MGSHGAASPLAPLPPPLSIDTACCPVIGATGEAADGEPLSPTARMFHDFYIVSVIGLGKPIDFHPARAGLEVTLVRHPRFCLDDVKLVKHALGCTVNDVLVGVTSAALSRYYFRKLGDDKDTNRSTCFRSVLFVNLRPTPGIQQLAKMMESGKHNDLNWGNRLGYIVLPFEIVKHDDPLDYVRDAKKTVDRKKHSFEAIATHLIAETVTKLFGIEVSTGLFHRMISSTTILFSNMIGPAEPVEFYGNPVTYIAPSNFGHPSALTIHWQSYMDTIKIILAVDDAQFLDSHDLLDDFAESLERIRNATSTTFQAQAKAG